VYKNFYQKYFEKELKSNEKGEILIHCPFHKDKHPSLGINLNNGIFHCFGCNVKGNARDWKELYVEKIMTIEVAEEFHKRLLKAKNILKYLEKKRGINLITIKKFMLGWDAERITIPIFDQNKNLANIRKYSSTSKQKMISFAEGSGEARLYPIQNLSQKNYVLLCEGEMDCLLANQKKLNAITVTSGAGVWREKWNELFKNKKVYICFDNDETGRVGAKNIAKQLFDYTEFVKIIKLPITEPKGADITNYFVDYGYSIQEFISLIKNTSVFKLEEEKKEINNEMIYVHLSEASKKEFYNQKIKIKAVIAGKDLAPYIVPKKIKFECNSDSSRCSQCGCSSGNKTIILKNEDNSLLQLIDTYIDNIKGYFRKKAKILSNCYNVKMQIEDTFNIEQIFLIPELDFSAEEQEYVLRKAFYVGHGLKTNQNYTFEAITTPEPKTHYATQ